MRNTKRSIAGKVFMGLAVTACALLLMEGGARLFPMASSPEVAGITGQLGRIFMGTPELGWKLRPNFHGRFEDDIWRDLDEQGFLSVDSAQIADTRTPRVVFIGDSNTFAFGVPTDASFVEVVDRRLPGASVINLGVPGYSSAQGLIVARKYFPQLKPRIAVISFNFNDRRLAPKGSDTPERFRAIYRMSSEYLPNRMSRAMEWSYAFRMQRRLMQLAGTVPDGSSWLAELNLADGVPRVNEAQYRRNLADLVALCLANHVRPVFLLLRDNPKVTRELYRGIARLEAGDVAGAVPPLEATLETDLEYVARMYLSTAYRRLGDEGRAEAILRVPGAADAPDVDGLDPVRLDIVYNQIMRDVAQASGVEVVDGASVLESIPEVFIDESHFNAKGHLAIGNLLAERLAAQLR